jgi:beta-N-acetylhexosaminidase
MNGRVAAWPIVILLGLVSIATIVSLTVLSDFWLDPFRSEGSSPGDEAALRIRAVTPSPTPSVSPEEERINAAVGQMLKGLTIEDKIGQMLMFGLDGTIVTEDHRRLIQEWRVGGFVLREANLDSPTQIRELSMSLQELALESVHPLGLLLAVDQEGGQVTRLHWPFTVFPAPAVVGTTGDPALARAMGKVMAEEMAAVGINMDLAPVLDVNDNPLNPAIGSRSFGADPQVVAEMGTAFLQGLHEGDTVATGKHFPGHGSTSTDSHVALPVVPKSLSDIHETELVPFEAAIGAGIDVIMTAHVAYPELDSAPLMPATLSEPILTGILRQEIGFTGVILTDEIGMAAITGLYGPGEAAVMAIAAGADMILAKGPLETQAEIRGALMEAVKSGLVSEERVDESVARILRLKVKYDVGGNPGLGLDVIGSAEHVRVADEISAASQ